MWLLLAAAVVAGLFVGVALAVRIDRHYDEQLSDEELTDHLRAYGNVDVRR